MSHSSTSRGSNNSQRYVICDCGMVAEIGTSWTDLNPGRRFMGCKNYRDGGCGFFQWYDAPMCNRSKQIIPRLLRRLDKKENEHRRLVGKLRNYVVIAAISCMVAFVCVALLVYQMMHRMTPRC